MLDSIKTYDNTSYLKPIWKGEEVHVETAFVLKNALEFISEIRLAYPIKKIIAVTSFDLKTVYQEGVDYTVTKHGDLQINLSGKIPFLTWDNYRLKTFTPNDHQLASADAIGAYRIGELFNHDDGMSQWMITVSYTHEQSDFYDIVPDKSDKVKDFINKLKTQKSATVVSYGDSITYGWGASGMHEVQKPPYSPPYNLMAIEYLQNRYGAKINHQNFSVSGMTTEWAEKDENLQKVIDACPDLVIFAFGMNDAGGFHPDVFYQKMKNVINKVRKVHSNLPFVIISPILPNPLVGFTAGSSIRRYHDEYPRAYQRLEQDEKGVVWVNVTAMHNLLLQRKNIIDTLSNNANHPNDFMHRIYAQAFLKTLLGDDFNL